MTWQAAVNRILDASNRVFGESVIYTPDGGQPFSITGIFDVAHIEVDPDTGAAVTSAEPVLGLKRDDLAAEPKPRDSVTVRGIQYRIVDKQPDGQGGINLILKRK